MMKKYYFENKNNKIKQNKKINIIIIKISSNDKYIKFQKNIHMLSHIIFFNTKI